MSEALGLAANIFGVVGAADVVFWSTANICDLLKRAKDAPAAASQLLGATRSLASVIAELRIWANEYQQLFRTSENGRRVEKEVFSALSRCAGELEALVKKLESHDIRKNRRSWAGRLAGNVGFAMSEAQIHHAMQMVIHHQTTLRTLIQVQGSKGPSADYQPAAISGFFDTKLGT
ncbi:hypothetical protein B0T16DRAFT_386301 [Cercophora newfieldiana]|uniref:Fungal N-terminal domain-containing protein n=1 Tax=Cercophora newfieldiana TaxID=92897 RepID=A0AA40D256_9PEZI|nr:hypothetical protein B0T16DRAFT_386301 [Cercophora newfieldiana]